MPAFTERAQVMTQELGDILASAARTSSGNGGDGVAVPEFARARFYLDVTAASGTSATLDVTIEELVNGQWYTLATFTQSTAAGRKAVSVSGPAGRKLRAAWTIGGTTPSFTFAVVGILEFGR
jgi:hypothetical protein